MRIVNLTGHPLTLSNGGHELELPSEGQARVRSQSLTEGRLRIDGLNLPVLRIVEQEIVDLPPPSSEVVYVVSGIVAAAAKRRDVLAPGRLHRNEVTGRVETAKALVRLETLRDER